MPKITFIPQSEFSRDIYAAPTPAVQHLPEWYKKMPVHMGKDSLTGISTENTGSTNTTAKACSPFLDALGFGYMYVAQADIEVRNVAGEYVLRWRTNDSLVESHTRNQHPGMPAAYNGADFAMKWICDFRIQTPAGYSTLFTHPLNRHDLPFRTFTGVVDTDAYPLNVNFPFQLIGEPKDQFIIPAGTPLCQMFPIRRETWRGEIGDYDPVDVKRNQYRFLGRIVRSYKSRYWHRKVFT